MTIPFVKIFSLGLRLFTKPVVSFAKTSFKKKTDHPKGVQKGLIALGQLQNRVNVRVQRMYLGVEYKEAKINPLLADKAFDAGAELVADVMVYGTLFVWGLYEIAKAAASSKAKEAQYKAALLEVKHRLETVQTKNEDLQANVTSLLSELQARKQAQDTASPS
jgi:hypothetical protein